MGENAQTEILKTKGVECKIKKKHTQNETAEE